MADSFDHCEELVRAGDKDRFLATLFAPQKYRRALYALYAFNLEVARTRELAREPMPGEIRLQWWRDVLGGAGRGEVDAHPVAAALRDVVVRYRLPPRMLAGADRRALVRSLRRADGEPVVSRALRGAHLVGADRACGAHSW